MPKIMHIQKFYKPNFGIKLMVMYKMQEYLRRFQYFTNRRVKEKYGKHEEEYSFAHLPNITKCPIKSNSTLYHVCYVEL